MGPALYKKIKEMEAVINRLMKMFGGLNTSELMDLKHALTTGEHSTVLWYRLCHYETSHLVFSIVQTYGQRSVELTKNLLESIGRIERLTWLDSGSCDYSPYDWWYALINKVATVAAVTELFGETLSLLKSEELKRFKKLLVLETLFHPPPHVDLRLLASANAEQTAALLLHTYGLKAVKTTFWILKKMRCSDVARNLQSKMTTGEPSKPKVATVKDLRKILLKLLAGLSDEEMCKFKMRLQLRYCRMDHAWLQEREADADGLVDLIFETSGQRCLQVITDVLEQMGKRDLVIDSLEGTGLKWFLDYTDSYTDIVSLKENSKASADVERVQVVLQELTDKQEEQTFKKHLQISCESNLSRRFVWNYIRIFSEPQDLVDLLVAVYGEFSSADVIQTVLSDMGRQDLMAKMSKPSVTSEGLGQRVEPDSWISAKDIWTKLEPKVQEIYSQFTYSLQSGEGQYECSVSGLRWSCEQSVSFQYRFGPWEEHLERLKELQYMPAGPLIDITVSSGRLDVVYLPHWVCVDNPDTEEKMTVLHINDSGDTLEKATKVTSSHVKLLEPVFSPRAVLIKLGFPVKIYCSLLIYKTNTAFLTLHVYLIPRDPGLKESMDRSKQHHGYSIIPKPHPDTSLKIRDQFVLKSHQETLEITPQKLTLRYQIPPNFYEVYTKNPDFDFKLELAQQNGLAPVWSCTVRQGEYTERKLAVPRPEGIHFVDKFELQLIQRVSNIAEILDHLLRAEVVGPEAYDTISILSTSQQKMRELFRGPLKSSGERGKDIFYRILKDKESYLCAELEGL